MIGRLATPFPIIQFLIHWLFLFSSYCFVTAADVNGCSNVDSLFINVLSLPIANAGGDTATCTGVSIQLSGSG